MVPSAELQTVYKIVEEAIIHQQARIPLDNFSRQYLFYPRPQRRKSKQSQNDQYFTPVYVDDDWYCTVSVFPVVAL